MPYYQFSTVWKFEYPIQQVWDLIFHMDQWPEWWTYVKEVEVLQTGDEREIGSIRRITWSTALPYTITFNCELTGLEMYQRIEGGVTGDLAGTGIWTFLSNMEGTTVRYDWTVATTRRWMNFFSPLARPIFKWNHDKVMKAGYLGLLQKMS